MKNFDDHIYNYMRSDEFRELVARDIDFTTPITVADALERLLIIHCKIWNIEDEVRQEGITLDKIAELRQKISYLNGVTRPRLVAAIGEMLARAVRDRNEELVREPNLKNYQGEDGG